MNMDSEDVPQWSLTTTSKKEKEKITKEKVENNLNLYSRHAVYKPTRDDVSCPNCSHVPTKRTTSINTRRQIS